MKLCANFGESVMKTVVVKGKIPLFASLTGIFG